MRSGPAAEQTPSLLTAYTAHLGQLSSRKKAEAALRAAAVESAIASRAKSEFLANMSHELRTPLNAIIGFSELVQNMAPNSFAASKHREYAKHISDAGRHLLQIISDILDISQVEAGAVNLVIEALAPKHVVDSCVTLLRERIHNKKQTLTIEVPEDLPLVAADALRLKQILINLMTNATKFTQEGGHIVVLARANQDASVTITVRDSGCGMAEEEIDYAMKPFTQVASSYSRNHEGTGLGLPITKALVIGQGGEFDLRSAPGIGTEASVTLRQASAYLTDQGNGNLNSEDLQ